MSATEYEEEGEGVENPPAEQPVLTESAFVAWTLHTGPEHPNPIWEKSRWISGSWNGLKETDEGGIARDMEVRVGMLLRRFIEGREELPEQFRGGLNYFMIPEFFFHCAHGAYPKMPEDFGDPFDYLCGLLRQEFSGLRFEDLAEGQKERWIVCCGSCLTSNLASVQEFLDENAEVKKRWESLSSALANIDAEEAILWAGTPRTVARKNWGFLRDNLAHVRALAYHNAIATPMRKEFDALMDQFRADPLCFVRNRGALLHLEIGSRGTDVNLWAFEKQNESTVDLTLGMLTGKGTEEEGLLRPETMLTEYLAGYPSISIIGGDKNTADGTETHFSGSQKSRITIAKENLEIGVEICLDHRLQRLRRTVGMTKENGADEDNPPLQVHLVPAGGMQLLRNAVVGQVLFNCCGCDPIVEPYSSQGKHVIAEGTGKRRTVITGVYSLSRQLKKRRNGKDYFCHSQIGFQKADDDPFSDGFNNALGKKNANVSTTDGSSDDEEPRSNRILDKYDVFKKAIEEEEGDTKFFSCGLGELHIYRPRLPDDVVEEEEKVGEGE